MSCPQATTLYTATHFRTILLEKEGARTACQLMWWKTALQLETVGQKVESIDCASRKTLTLLSSCLTTFVRFLLTFPVDFTPFQTQK